MVTQSVGPMKISDRAKRKEQKGKHPKMYPLELYPGQSRVLGLAGLVMMMTVMMMTVMMMTVMMMMNNGRQEGRWSPVGPCVN